jgi:adenylate cyclase
MTEARPHRRLAAILAADIVGYSRLIGLDEPGTLSALGHLGEVIEAQRVWRELKEINPKYSFEAHIAQLPWRNPAGPARIREGLAKAGLPE